jgi:mono/diheme cytochrome c family protein
LFKHKKQMKKLFIIAGILVIGAGLISCGGKGENPGRAYMPDMYYSRAYEAYNYNNIPGDYDLKSRGIYFTGNSVPGTIARGEGSAFPIASGDSGYAQAAAYRNPMDSLVLNPTQMKEAERIYLVNCGICHGTALDGNGPLWKGGDGPYPSAPRNLKDDYTKALSDGQMYHVITYGKGVAMGSYASQVKPEQRWWIIEYIRSKQGGVATTDSTAKSTVAVTDSIKKNN